jgi:DNA-directed RNA polymerase alpha subunit
MRVGQRTNYDRLILEIWTKGTVLPEDALVEAGMILRKHLNPFVLYHELGEEVVSPSRQAPEPSQPAESATEELLDKPVSILSLSVRASNCLEAARITTLRELVAKTEADLLRVRSFGKTSLHEVHRKLAEYNLSLGMTFGEAGVQPAQEPGAQVDAAEPSPPNPDNEGPATTPTPPTEQSDDCPETGESGPMEVFTMPE